MRCVAPKQKREELLFIIANSGSTALVVEDLKTLNKLQNRLNDLPIQLVILLSDETPPTESILKVVNFSQLIEIGGKPYFCTKSSKTATP